MAETAKKRPNFSNPPKMLYKWVFWSDLLQNLDFFRDFFEIVSIKKFLGSQQYFEYLQYKF